MSVMSNHELSPEQIGLSISTLTNESAFLKTQPTPQILKEISLIDTSMDVVAKKNDSTAFLGIITGRDAAWRLKAACRGTDTSLFFPRKEENTTMPLEVCGKCEVRVECLEFAYLHNENKGIWGGKTARERARLRRDRNALNISKKS